MSAEVRHWTTLDVGCCGHCPFRGRLSRERKCERESPVHDLEDLWGEPPQWCPLRKAQVIVRVAGDRRLP